MTDQPRHIDHPDAADLADDGPRAVWALRWMAERALIHGSAAEKAMAARLLDYLDTGDEGGFEAALGIGGPGHTGALRRYRLDRRADTLRRLWRRHWPGLSANAAAALIAQQWRRCTCTARPRRLDPDDPATAFYDLLDQGHDPLSPRRVREILSDELGELQPVEAANGTDDL